MKKLLAILCILGTIFYAFAARAAENQLLSPEWWTTATPETVKDQIKLGAATNAKNEDGWTPLMFAAQFSLHPKNIDILAVSDINERDNEGWTALMHAAIFNTVAEVTESLIKKGADVNAKNETGMTALMEAAQFNSNAHIIDILLEAGAEIDAKNKKGATALMYAAGFNSINAVEHLTGVKMVIEKKRDGEMVAKLVKSDIIADVDARDNEGMTPLMYAAASLNDTTEIIMRLVRMGADVNAQTISGQTALMIAAQKSKHRNVISKLIDYSGCERFIIKDSIGKTAIDYANENQYIRNTDVYIKLNDMEKCSELFSD